MVPDVILYKVHFMKYWNWLTSIKKKERKKENGDGAFNDWRTVYSAALSSILIITD